MKRTISILALLVILMATFAIPVGAASPKSTIGINVLLNTDVSDPILVELETYGKVRTILYEIDALTMQVRQGNLALIQALPFVEAANPDAERTGAPIDTVVADDFMDGLSTWNLDVINVTNPGFNSRQVNYDGEGVYVAVLDTGLVDSWRQYFPQERIAVEFATAFSGGPTEGAANPEQPNKWEHDQNSHGTHVTSTILGYSFRGTPVNGVAPMAKVIPVKVINQNGSGWSSVIAQGIVYVTDLKLDGALGESPVVINMSLGGSVLDAMEKAAIDYAVANGVVIVAAAGNGGTAGMHYPGAYDPVISVAASGWASEWLSGSWWYSINDPDPNNPANYYITDFSSRELEDQDLDVAAPGSWVVGPYKINSSNQPTYYFLGGTSMASPHVAGIVALMLQKNSGLTASDVETILESSALHLDPGCLTVTQPAGPQEFCWEADATGSGLALADAALAATP